MNKKHEKVYKYKKLNYWLNYIGVICFFVLALTALIYPERYNFTSGQLILLFMAYSIFWGAVNYETRL